LPGAPDHYTTFHLGEAPLGGLGGMMNPNAGPPSHWLAYFSVTDTARRSPPRSPGAGRCRASR
jgi:predicted enzyme related to lactoylglutathione lyase